MKGTERLAELLSELTEAEKHTVGVLLGQVAHDLNNELSAIMMELYTLKRRRKKIHLGSSELTMEQLNELLSSMAEAIDNLDSATSCAASYIEFLEEAGIALRSLGAKVDVP